MHDSSEIVGLFTSPAASPVFLFRMPEVLKGVMRYSVRFSGAPVSPAVVLYSPHLKLQKSVRRGERGGD